MKNTSNVLDTRITDADRPIPFVLVEPDPDQTRFTLTELGMRATEPEKKLAQGF